MGGGGGGGGANGGCSQEGNELDRILVRFRPIASKPAIPGTGFTSDNTNSAYLRKARAKRRYVRTKSRVVPEEKNNGSDRSGGGGGGGEIITLSLLPEAPVPMRSSLSDNPTDYTTKRRTTMSVNISTDPTAGLKQKTSVVLVECVEGLGVVNNHVIERMMDLENDTCPGFVSDGYDRIWWTNQSYRSMVGSDEVWLVMKERFPLTSPALFICRVRWQYICRRDNSRKTMVVPCDVLRMHGGDFAWRLDVQAALSLGR